MKFLLFLTIFIFKVYLASSDYYNDVESLRNALGISDMKNYIKSQSTVSVSVGLSVVNLYLDSQRETMTFTGKFTMTWSEPHLAWTSSNYRDLYSVHLKDGDIWTPNLVIENMIDDIKVLHDENIFYRLYNTSVVVMDIPVSASVHCPLNFVYYPFDKQTCGIILSSWSYDHSEMPLYPLSDKVNLQLYQERSEFKVVNSDVESTQETELLSGRTCSKMTFNITVRRHTQFYGFTIILPLVLLSLLTILTFLLPLESGEKASYSVTLLLMVAIYYALALEYIPVFTGVSVLVGYISAVLILATVATLCEFLIMYFYYQDHQREMKPYMISLLHILAKVTCKLDTVEDSRSLVTSEGTSSTRVSDHDLPACSSLPNGGHESKKSGGRLTPINCKVRPLGNTSNDPSRKELRQNSLPPLDCTPHTDSITMVREQASVSELLSERKPKIKEIPNSSSPWQLMAKCLDTLFLVIFLIISFITHFIFLVIIGTGSL